MIVLDSGTRIRVMQIGVCTQRTFSQHEQRVTFSGTRREVLRALLRYMLSTPCSRDDAVRAHAPSEAGMPPLGSDEPKPKPDA